MEIGCPECSKKYKIDESLIPDKGRKVKCKKCGSVFFVKKDEPSEENADFNLDLDFGKLQNNGGEGTVRISKEQIQASLQKTPIQLSNETHENLNSNVDQNKIELDIEKPIIRKTANYGDIPIESGEKEHLSSIEEETYKVKIDGEEFNSLDSEKIKLWIEEDRLLETDLIAREGSDNWIELDKVPKFKKVIDLHVYSQRKMLEQEDNPFKKFQQNQQTEVKKESFLDKILSIFKKG